MNTLQDLRKVKYRTIKAFAEAYQCSPSKASGILNGKYHLTLSKDEVRHLASILKVDFVTCADACDNTFAELKGYKGDEWKKTARTHKGIWERWRYGDELLRDTEKAAKSGDWSEYRKKYTSSYSSSQEKQSTRNASPTPYDLLGVPLNATPDEIRQAFRAKVRAMHPDAGGKGGNADDLTHAKEDALKYAER